jgi:hypothetical protein
LYFNCSDHTLPPPRKLIKIACLNLTSCYMIAKIFKNE